MDRLLLLLLQPLKSSALADSDDEVIVTSIGFADRQASREAAAGFDTEKAIADLYAHVAQMPDSAHKRRLMKQVTTTFFLCLDIGNLSWPCYRERAMDALQHSVALILYSKS